MGLFKRKPVGSGIPTEKEARQRTRLVKPQTSRSSTNLAVLALQQSASQSTISVQSESSQILARPASAIGDRRLSEKARPVSTVQEERESAVGDVNGDDIGWHGAAVVINAMENTLPSREDTVSPISTQAQKPRRPFSAMMFGSRRTSGSHMTSRNFSFEEAPRSTEVNPGSETLVEVVIEGAPRVLERKASFTPGAATRLHKASSEVSSVIARKPIPQLRKELSYELASSHQLCDADKVDNGDKTLSPIFQLSQSEIIDFERDWEPPPQIERSATPSDLDYHYLGGLRLGSLHVTNGRVSPAPSELAKHPLHRPSALLRRYASSEYGSETGSIKRTHSPPPSAWKPSKSKELLLDRKFSQESRATRELSYGSESSFTAQSHVNELELPKLSTDRTVSMAMSYMTEMGQVSPFSPQQSFPNSPFTPQRSPEPEQTRTSHRQQRSVSPTGSVLVTSKKSEHEAELFDDETVGESQGSEGDRDTISTCRTPSDATSHRANPFDTYNKLRDSPSQGHLQPPQDARGETSDSGYSSNASLQSMKEERKSLVAQRIKAFEQPRAESAAAQLPATGADGGKKLGPRPFRASILKFHRKTAPDLPTMSSFSQMSTASAASSVATTSTIASRPKTPSKKLQKKRPSSQPGPLEDIMVTGAQSSDESEVPPIPQLQSANLMARSQQFPELQRTFKSMHHTKDSASSVLSQTFDTIDIRFPSPPPEPASDEEKPRRRSKSPSPRRDSFIARATRRQSMDNHKSLERPSSGIGEAEAQTIIRHFGTTANSLGGSPYDIAKAANTPPTSRSASREGRITPHNISATPAVTPDRRRLTMDDRTASEFARSKSRSIAERDRQDSVENLKRLETEKRATTGDKAGKKPRPYSVQPGMMASLAKMPVKKLYSAPKGANAIQQRYETPAIFNTANQRPAYVPPRPHNTQQQYEGPVPQQQSQSQPHESRVLNPSGQAPRLEQEQASHHYETPAPPVARQHMRSETENQYWPEQQQYSQSPQRPAPLPPRHSPRPQQQQYRPTAEESAPSPFRQSPSPGRRQYEEPYEMAAPVPPTHSPRPAFVEPDEEMEETSIAPPPPSHSPRPMDLQTSEPAADVWAAQAQAWENRRKSVGEFLGFNSDDLQDSSVDHDQRSACTDEAVVEEELYPSIPPRESRKVYEFHSQTSDTPHERHDAELDQPQTSFWEPAAHHHSTTYEPQLSSVTPTETFQDPAMYPYVAQEEHRQSPAHGQHQQSLRPLPKPKSRRTSGVSQAHSHASSLAEELNPDISERPQPPLDFGRYSGGLQYSYEKGKGFGGSAGTRSMSGKAQGARKSVPLSAEVGLDFSDIPVIAGMRRV